MRQKPINWFKVRIFLIVCLLFLCFITVVARMFQLQVLKKEQLYKLASQQHQIEIPLVPKRGAITDRKGNDLAVSIEADSLCADPRKVSGVDRTAKALASILNAEESELKQRLKSRSSFEWIRRKITPGEVEQIKALRLPGLFFLKENKRFYPNAQLASHVVGFVGLDSRGLEGIEVQFDSLLNGRGKTWKMDRDALGRGIAKEETLQDREEHYQNVILTLDKQVQHEVETELSQAVQKWGAKGGFVIAMDPFTGRILAMATYPSFNPNQFLQYRSSLWRNRAISDTFEPGSLFKAFLAAVAIEEKVVRPSDSFYCENGSYTVHDRTIHDTSRHGWLTFQQIIKISSNIGASKVGEKVGKDRLYRYLGTFGFGEKTRIGLPGEGKGIIHHPRYWAPVTLDTISFGQGISVTGIQLITALSAIANGGVLVKPSVVERVTNEKGETVQAPQPEEVRRVISQDTARKVALLLKATTEKGGTGEGAVPAGYEVAGKTGTAQKVDTRLGGYAEDRFTSGFMGFGPIDHPKLALLVVIDEPQGVNYGGVVAAPVFKSIMEKTLPLLNAFPKGTTIVKDTTEEGSGNGRQVRVSIDAEKIRRVAGGDVMPDLTGLPMRTAMSRIEGKGLIIKVSGNGKLIDQVPKAGTVIEKGDLCYLKFQSPSEKL
jgi:cell division protein FtsI (penicillin-binding protein 3)